MFKATSSESRVCLRVVLYKNEVLRLPRRSHGVVVREGTAWMTKDGRDTIIRAGETAGFEAGKWVAVVQAVSGRSVIEVLGEDDSRSAVISPPTMNANSVCQGSAA